MIAMLAVDIHLLPDWTFGVQLGIFLCTLGVLHILIFRPILRIIDHRKKFTSQARQEAEQLIRSAAQHEAERQKRIEQMLLEARSEQLERLALAHQRAEATIETARKEARNIYETAAQKTRATEKAAAELIPQHAEMIAQEIVARIVGPSERTEDEQR